MAQKGITFTIPDSTPIDQTLFGHEFNFTLSTGSEGPHLLHIKPQGILKFLNDKFVLLAYHAGTKTSVQCQVDAKTYFPISWDLTVLKLYSMDDSLRMLVTPQFNARSHIKTMTETSQTLRTFYTEDYNLPISMKANFNVQLGSDFRILVHGKTIYVHKFVLLQSPVLTAMLETQMTEAAENTMEISDFDYETVYELFGYLYLGKSEVINSVKSLANLYAIFDKYDVKGPKEDIKLVLPTLFKLETIAEGLVAIEPYPELCEIGINWITKNWKEIKGRKDWLALMETGDYLQAMLKIMAFF